MVDTSEGYKQSTVQEVDDELSVQSNEQSTGTQRAVGERGDNIDVGETFQKQGTEDTDEKAGLL